eukprot:GDKI01015660.1.p1 GENE.GDKI01015660.1~~GDKI01015660.1.p1  ORF type:complete len:182 (-),score=16.73 GDKI01015660.1:88-633(-)
MVGIANKTIDVHRLVAETFLPNQKLSVLQDLARQYPGKTQEELCVYLCVDHIQQGKENRGENAVANLRWVTSQQNTHAAIEYGMIRKPVQLLCQTCGHTEDQPSGKIAARRLNVHQSTVSKAAANGKILKGEMCKQMKPIGLCGSAASAKNQNCALPCVFSVTFSSKLDPLGDMSELSSSI